MSTCREIVVLGDAMEDVWVGCDVTRIAQDAPVPVGRIIDVTKCPGGAMNVVANLEAMTDGVAVRGVYGSRLSYKTRYYDRATGVVLGRYDEDYVSAPIDEAIEIGTPLVVVDYGKGSFSSWRGGRDKGYVHTKSPKSYATHLTFFANEAEYKANKETYDRAARVYVTYGPLGARCLARGHFIAGCDAWERTPALPGGVCGAGDTFMAAVIAAELEGAAPEVALRRGCAAGALAVSHRLTACVSRADINRFLGEPKWAAQADAVTRLRQSPRDEDDACDSRDSLDTQEPNWWDW